MDSLQHKFTEVNGIKMHYVEQGTGPLMLFMHGFPDFWYSWNKQIEHFAKNYRVVAPDMRGYGQTDAPKDVDSYAPPVLAKDIMDLIEALGEKKAIIVGHDWGGAVAWYLGQNHPEYVERLIVLNSPHPTKFAKALNSNWAQIRKSWYMFMFQLPWIPEWFMGRDIRKMFKATFRGWAYNKQAFPNEVIDKYVEAFTKPDPFKGPLNYYRAAFKYRKNKPKGKPQLIGSDTLLIWGENDKALGKELTYDLDKYFTGQFELRYISECSHWVQHDHPDTVNQYIEEFITADQPAAN